MSYICIYVCVCIHNSFIVALGNSSKSKDKKTYRDFPGGPVVKAELPLQGVWVSLQVGELESCIPQGTTKKKSGNNRNTVAYMTEKFWGWPSRIQGPSDIIRTWSLLSFLDCFPLRWASFSDQVLFFFQVFFLSILLYFFWVSLLYNAMLVSAAAQQNESAMCIHVSSCRECFRSGRLWAPLPVVWPSARSTRGQPWHVRSFICCVLHCCRNGREGGIFDNVPGRKTHWRAGEGQLGIPGNTEPKAQACCPWGLYLQLEVRWPSEKEYRNVSHNFGLFRLPGPCSTPWVGELQPSGFPDLADAFNITISVEKIRNHPTPFWRNFWFFHCTALEVYFSPTVKVPAYKS